MEKTKSLMPKRDREKVKKENGKIKGIVVNAGLKVLRVVVWTFLIILMIRGGVSILKPATVSQDNSAQIEELNARIDSVAYAQTEESKLYNFVEAFANQYCTYTAWSEADFKDRIQQYVTERFYSTEGIYNFSSENWYSCEPLFVSAYETETVSNNQVNVYVRIITQLTSQVPVTVEKQVQVEVEVDGEIQTQTQTESTTEYETDVSKYTYTLEVPVYINEQGEYIVEDIPVMQSYQNGAAAGYTENVDIGEKADIANLDETITNFLTAYYGESQSAADYFISDSADKAKFTVQGTQWQLISVTGIRAYTAEEENKYLVVAGYYIQNERGTQTFQRLTLTVNVDGETGQVYIEDINPRTGIVISGSEE